MPERSLLALDVVDGVLATEDEDEEQRGKAPAEADHEARPDAVDPLEAGGIGAASVDELLEHERVLGLLDDLVVGVAELGRAVGQLGCELQETPLEHGLELQAGLHHLCGAVQAEPGPGLLRLALVPRGGTQAIAFG